MPPDTAILPGSLRRVLEDVLGERVVTADAIGGGYTPARRLRLSLERGSSVFVKAATTDKTAGWRP